MTDLAPSLDRRAVVAQLDQAGRTLRAMPSRGCFPAAFRSSWPALLPDLGEDEEPIGGAAPTLPRPSPAAIAHMDAVLGWVAFIPAAQAEVRQVVHKRALGWSWRRIGKALGRSYEAARRWHGEGIEWIVRGLARNAADTPVGTGSRAKARRRSPRLVKRAALLSSLAMR